MEPRTRRRRRDRWVLARAVDGDGARRREARQSSAESARRRCGRRVRSMCRRRLARARRRATRGDLGVARSRSARERCHALCDTGAVQSLWANAALRGSDPRRRTCPSSRRLPRSQSARNGSRRGAASRSGCRRRDRGSRRRVFAAYLGVESGAPWKAAARRSRESRRSSEECRHAGQVSGTGREPA
jgi:hypothetical protein